MGMLGNLATSDMLAETQGAWLLDIEELKRRTGEREQARMTAMWNWLVGSTVNFCHDTELV